MEFYLAFTFTFLIMLFASAAWYLRCNDKTYDYRVAVIRNSTFENHGFELISRISYDDTLWAFFWFRDVDQMYRDMLEEIEEFG